MRTHTNEKPYRCGFNLLGGGVCEKRFADKSNLKRHKLAHQRVTAFKCTWVDKATGVPWAKIATTVSAAFWTSSDIK